MEDAKDIFKNKLGDKVDDLKKGDEAVVVPVILDEEKVVDDWLKYHEKEPGVGGSQKYGHTKERHVGKSDEELVKRLNDQYETYGKVKIKGSSSYTNLETAQNVISNGIRSKKSDIKSWLGPDRTDDFIIEFPTDEIIGKGISKEDFLYAINNNIDPKKMLKEMKNAKIILRKNPNGNGYFILTSHPY